MLINKINSLKAKDSEYQVEIFFIYHFSDHMVAHLYEHLVVAEIKRNYKNFSIRWADTGSGIINIRLKGNREIIKKSILESILSLKNIKQFDFNLEKDRLIYELVEIINKKSRFFYQVAQCHFFNYKEAQQTIAKIKKMKFNSLKKFITSITPEQQILILAGPTLKTSDRLKQEQIKNLIDVNNKKIPIPPKLINLNTNCLNNFNYNQINFKIEIKNNIEAYFLQLIGRQTELLLQDFFIQQGIYELKSDLFKDYGQYLYLNYSFFSYKQKSKKILNLIINFLQNLNLSKSDMLVQKKNIIENLKEIDGSDLNRVQDYVWQILEWGNYFAPKEIIKSIDTLTLKESKSWWFEKISRSDFYKVILGC